MHRLWGGAWRTRSGFHADLVPDEPERMAEDALARVAEGFRTLYFKVGFAPEVDEARVRAVREAVGDGPRIRVDANGAWSPGLAKRLLDRLAAYDLEYIEQPIPPGDPEELARLRARVAVPILAHESSLSVEGTLAVVRHGAADAVQLDPRFDAGIAGARTAAQIAEVAGLPALTHTFGELGVGTALMLHFHAAHRNLRARLPDVLPEPHRRRDRGRADAVRRLLPRRPAGRRASVSISIRSASRTTRRSMPARWRVGRRRRRTIPTTTATT